MTNTSLISQAPQAEHADQTEIARYVPLFSGFTVATALLVHLATRREPQRAEPLELVEAMLATFFITRVVAHERVGALVRAPFVEPATGADPTDAKGDAKRPTGTGVRRSLGELVTCTRCLGPWAGAAVTFGRVFAPRQARLVTRVMALAGANSMIHAGHAAACGLANHDPRH